MPYFTTATSQDILMRVSMPALLACVSTHQPEMFMKLDKDEARSSGQSSCPDGTIQRRDGP